MTALQDSKVRRTTQDFSRDGFPTIKLVTEKEKRKESKNIVLGSNLKERKAGECLAYL